MVSRGAEGEEKASGVLGVTRDSAIATLAAVRAMPASVGDEGGGEERPVGELGRSRELGRLGSGREGEKETESGPPALGRPSSRKKRPVFFFLFF
jgi:hypothetical protein